MAKNLATKYRPRHFKDVVGQGVGVKKLQGMIESQEIPHALLITGATGCGKTTLARMVARYVNCKTMDACGKCPSCLHNIDKDQHPDFKEVNIATDGGKDAIIGLINQAKFKPRYNMRVMLLDECFHKDTLIETSKGQIPIHKVKVGDTVKNGVGSGRVSNTFKTDIPLNRVVLLKLSCGSIILCSDNHLFYTDKGWIPAKQLDKTMQIRSTNEKDMRCVQKELRGSRWQSNGVQSLQNQEEKMRTMFEDVQTTYESSFYNLASSFLLSDLRWEMEKCATELPSENLLFRNSEKNSTNKTSLLSQKRKTGTAVSQDYVGTLDKKESYATFKEQAESNGVQEEKWYRIYGKTWRQRSSANKTSTTDCTKHEECENGVRSFIGEAYSRLSDLLQTGYSLPLTIIRSGSGWVESFWKSGENKGPKKGKNAGVTRLENIAFYQRRSDRDHFARFISDSEREKGAISLYDIEVDSHPSYFANGVMVHNCHNLTPAAAESLLKPLEHPPESTLWILATTDPQKLKPTIVNRCQPVTLSTLDQESIIARLKYICKREELKFNDKVLGAIADSSGGYMRQAITTLESVQYFAKAHKGEKLSDEKLNKILVEQAIQGAGGGMEIDRLVMGCLNYIYIGKFSSFLNALAKVGQNDYVQFVNKMLWFNGYLIDSITVKDRSPNVWHTPQNRLFKDLVKKGSASLLEGKGLGKLLLLQQALVRLRMEMQTFAVSPARIQIYSVLYPVSKEFKS